MIKYSEVTQGDILKITGQGAPGFAQLGDLVRVTLPPESNRVDTENTRGQKAFFAFNCGAERLEATEWKNDFPNEIAKAS